MDMRNGDLHASRDAALEAGVPSDEIAEVEPVAGSLEDPEIVRVTSGPFKGRVYERNRVTRQLERRKRLEGRK